MIIYLLRKIFFCIRYQRVGQYIQLFRTPIRDSILNFQLLEEDTDSQCKLYNVVWNLKGKVFNFALKIYLFK